MRSRRGWTRRGCDGTRPHAAAGRALGRAAGPGLVRRAGVWSRPCGSPALDINAISTPCPPLSDRWQWQSKIEPQAPETIINVDHPSCREETRTHPSRPDPPPCSSQGSRGKDARTRDAGSLPLRSPLQLRLFPFFLSSCRAAVGHCPIAGAYHAHRDQPCLHLVRACRPGPGAG